MRWWLLLLVHVVVVRGWHVPQERRKAVLRGGRGLLQHGFVEVAEGPTQVLKIDL